MNWTAIRTALVAWVRAATGLDAEHVYVSQAGRPRPSGRCVEISTRRVGASGRDWVDAAFRTLVHATMPITGVDPTANNLTCAASHNHITGDGPVQLATTGTLPGGLALDTDYWVVDLDGNKFKLAESFSDAMAAVPVTIDITDEGVGSHSVIYSSATVRPGEEVTYTVRGAREIVVQLQCFEGIGNAVADSPVDYLERARIAARLPARAAAFRAAGIGLGSVGSILALDGDLGFTVFEPRAVLEVRFHATSEATELGTSIETVQVTNEMTDPDHTFTIEA